MCLAIPGKIVEISADKKVASVDFGGVKQQVRLDLFENVDERLLGSYVLVHVGYAIELMSQQEGEATVALFSEYLDVVEKELQGEPR